MTIEERQEAAKWFQNRASHTSMPGAKMMFERAAEALSEGMQPHWIPCSERLPERGTSILMASRQGWVAEGEYKGVIDGRHLWIEYRWSASLTNGEIIAWMPFPEPYRGETE